MRMNITLYGRKLNQHAVMDETGLVWKIERDGLPRKLSARGVEAIMGETRLVIKDGDAQKYIFLYVQTHLREIIEKLKDYMGEEDWKAWAGCEEEK